MSKNIFQNVRQVDGVELAGGELPGQGLNEFPVGRNVLDRGQNGVCAAFQDAGLQAERMVRANVGQPEVTFDQDVQEKTVSEKLAVFFVPSVWSYRMGQCSGGAA